MSQYVPVDLRGRIRERFLSCCAYCQTAESLTVATFEIEHVVPSSLSGATDFQNLCLACPAGNLFKSNRTHGTTDAGGDSVLFHPQQYNWLEHFDWSVDGTVIVGLTEVGEATIRTLRMNRPQVVEVRLL